MPSQQEVQIRPTSVGLRVLRPKALAQELGVSLGTLYGWEKAGVLPRRRRIGPNVSGWLLSEIIEWLETRPHESCLDSTRIQSLQVARQEAKAGDA